MAFTHDTELSLNATAALVNTGRAPVDEMPDVAALDAFIAHWQWTGSRTHDEAELAAVLALRDRLARLWEMTAGRGRGPGEHAAGRTRTRCRSWSSTTAGTTTSTRPRPTRRWPTGWRSTRRWPSPT